MTRANLLDTMSQKEFVYWCAREETDPIYDGWIANAINCETVCTASLNKIKATRQHFLPYKIQKQTRQKSAMELLAEFRKYGASRTK